MEKKKDLHTTEKTTGSGKINSKKTESGHKTWYKLDLSAIVYPTLQRRDFSSVYRLSVLLKEPIRPDILQQAVDVALKRFPTYKTAIRKGLFWRYLEPNTRPGPFVQEDIRNFCMPMPFKAGNRYLLRIYYHGCRISLEAHHCLGDGTGGMAVLQTITAVYLRLLGHSVSNEYFVMDINEAPDPEELEDAYMRYANAKVCPPRPGEKTYRVRGTKEPFYTLNIIDGIMSVSQVMAVAKKYDATITEYLNAVLLYALMTKQQQEQTKAKQKAIDDFLADPSSENAARLNELGVTPKSLENESARRTMNRHQLNELAKEKEAAKKKKKPKTYSASDYLKAVQ